VVVSSALSFIAVALLMEMTLLMGVLFMHRVTKNTEATSLNEIFNIDYSSLPFQVVVVDLVHEILQK